MSGLVMDGTCANCGKVIRETSMSENKIMISDEAVEAAAKAVYGGDHLDGSPQREAWLADFRKALDAAAPLIFADAFDQAASASGGVKVEY